MSTELPAGPVVPAQWEGNSLATTTSSLLNRRGLAALAATLAAIATAAQANAQCVPTWEWVGGLTGRVFSLEVFDAGAGPTLWAAGENLTWPGGGPASVVRWNGQTWIDSDANLPTAYIVTRLEAANLGAGNRLYAGTLNNAYRWAGAAWVREPNSAPANLVSGYMASMEDLLFGGQNAMYYSGQSQLVRWTGSGAPQTIATFQALVLPHGLAVFDDGGGPRLYFGGTFTSISGVPAKAIARWDGTTWSAVGNITNGTNGAWVHDLLVFDDGSGAALYASGNFAITGPGGSSRAIARWRGTAWEPLPGVPSTVIWLETLAAFDDGGGPRLYAGGFSFAGANVMVWNGSTWAVVGGGLPRGPTNEGDVLDLAVFDDGGGPRLYAAGDFGNPAGKPRALARLRCLCGDANGDGQVDQLDLDLALAAFGVSAGGDVNEDGVTNQDDLDLILYTFGGPCVAR